MLAQQAPASSTTSTNIRKMISGNEKYCQETHDFLKKYKDEILINSGRDAETEATSRQNGYGECLSTSMSQRGLDRSHIYKKAQISEDAIFIVNLRDKNLSYISHENLPRNLDQIHMLDISNNQLHDIPTVLLNMHSLRNLKLDGNSLRSFPPILCDRLRLETFSISDNLINTIPENIVSWKESLISLNFEKNLIEIIPETICSLHKLRALYLSQNHFLFLPTGLKKLKNLNELSLDWFKYTNPPLLERLNGTSGAKIIESLLNFCEGLEGGNCRKGNSVAEKPHPKSCKNSILEKKPRDEKTKKAKTIFEFIKNKLRSSHEIKKPLSEENIQMRKSFDEGTKKVSEIKSNIDFPLFAKYFSTKDFNFHIILPGKQTLYHKAVSEGDCGMLRILLKFIPEYKDYLDEDGLTPLYLAIKTEKYQAAKILISNGADGKKGCKEPCLILALKKLQYFLVQDLLRFGADPNEGDEEDGNTPIHFLFAMFSSDTHLFGLIGELLLKYGANPNKRNKERWCPVHLSVQRNQVDAIKWITENGQNFFLNDKIKFKINKHGGTEKWTPLHMATVLNLKKMANFLIEKGADVFAVNQKNKTPKDLAISDPLLLRMLRKAEKKALSKEIISRLPKPRQELFHIGNMSEIMDLEGNDGSLYENYSILNKNTQDKKLSSNRAQFFSSVASLSIKSPSLNSHIVKDSSEDDEEEVFSDVNENPSEFNIFENDADFFSNKMKQFRFDSKNLHKIEKINEIMLNIEKEREENKFLRKSKSSSQTNKSVNTSFSDVNPKKYKCLARNLKMNTELVDRNSKSLTALLNDRSLPISEKCGMFSTLKQMITKRRFICKQFIEERRSIEKSCESMRLSSDKYEKIYQIYVKDDSNHETRDGDDQHLSFIESDNLLNRQDTFLKKCLSLIHESNDEFHLDSKSRAFISFSLSSVLVFYLVDLKFYENLLRRGIMSADELTIMKYENFQVLYLILRMKRLRCLR